MRWCCGVFFYFIFFGRLWCEQRVESASAMVHMLHMLHRRHRPARDAARPRETAGCGWSPSLRAHGTTRAQGTTRWLSGHWCRPPGRCLRRIHFTRDETTARLAYEGEWAWPWPWWETDWRNAARGRVVRGRLCGSMTASRYRQKMHAVNRRRSRSRRRRRRRSGTRSRRSGEARCLALFAARLPACLPQHRAPAPTPSPSPDASPASPRGPLAVCACVSGGQLWRACYLRGRRQSQSRLAPDFAFAVLGPSTRHPARVLGCRSRLS